MSRSVAAPSGLLTDVTRRLEEARAHAPQSWAKVLAADRIPSTLARVWICSDFVAAACTRDPSLLEGLLESGRLFERADHDWILRDLSEPPPDANEATVMET